MAHQNASKRTKLQFIRQAFLNRLFLRRPKILLKKLFEAQVALLL
jgi:hypothetical protein